MGAAQNAQKRHGPKNRQLIAVGTTSTESRIQEDFRDDLEDSERGAGVGIGRKSRNQNQGLNLMYNSHQTKGTVLQSLRHKNIPSFL